MPCVLRSCQAIPLISSRELACPTLSQEITMPSFNHILFPVDFSERCLAVRPFVKATARQFDAKVTLIHVIQIPVAWYGGTETAYPVAFDVSTMQEELRVELGRFFNSQRPPTSRHRRELGDPA